MIVIDASALLAFLFEEPGHEQVGPALEADAVMSTVNLSEVLGRLARDGHDTNELFRRLLASPITFVPFDQVPGARLGAARFDVLEEDLGFVLGVGHGPSRRGAEPLTRPRA